MESSNFNEALEAIKELQVILYLDPIDQEQLTKQIEKVRTKCSNEEIDHELIMAFSLNYQRIPILIPFLSKKSLELKQFIHYDQDLLTILLKNGIDFPVYDILFSKNQEKLESSLFTIYMEALDLPIADILRVKEKSISEIELEEELITELEKKEIKFNKTKTTIRQKAKIEKVIEEDDVESLRLLSNQFGFNFNQQIQKINRLYKYTKIPIILFCIEKHAIKCFKYLLLNGSDPLQTITDLPSFNRWDDQNPPKKINGMTFGVEIGNLQIMELIEEKGGKIDQNCIFGAAKFHQNHILKWIIQKNQNQQDLIFGLFSSTEYNNFECVSLILDNGADINAKDIIYQNMK